MNQKLVVATLCGVLSACAVSPNFVAPQAPSSSADYVSRPLPEQTYSANGVAQRLVPATALTQPWWELFGSEPLNQAVTTALAQNPSSQAAEHRYQIALQHLAAQRGGELPAVELVAGVSRAQLGAGTTGGFAAPAFTSISAAIQASYTFDFFGGRQRRTENLAAIAQQSLHQRDALRLQLSLQVVSAALNEARLRARIQGQMSILTDLSRLASISEKQFELGAVAKDAVLQTQGEVATVQAQLLQLQQALDAQRNEIAGFLGLAPSACCAEVYLLQNITLPAAVPVALPATVLAQRPDVQASLAAAQAAQAEVGVAIAQQFPQLTIGASLGSDASVISELFRNSVWSLGANLLQPVFNHGTLEAQKQAALAAVDAAHADYRTTVLNGYQQIANALAGLHYSARIAANQTVAMQKAEASLALSKSQYQLGGISTRELLLSQTAFTRTQATALEAQTERYLHTAALLVASGGALPTPSTLSPAAHTGAAQ